VAARTRLAFSRPARRLKELRDQPQTGTHEEALALTLTSRRQNAAMLKPEEICLASRPRQRAERSDTVISVMPPPSTGKPPARTPASVYC
jgi:hypothetical protein